MSAKPGNGLSKDGLTRRDCFHAIYVGSGPVACDRTDCQSLTGGFCVGRKLCKRFYAKKPYTPSSRKVMK